MKIWHWVPSGGPAPPWPMVISWVNVELPEGMTKKFVRGLPGSVETYWNCIMEDFLESDAEWLFSTHDDVEFVPGTLKRLLSWNKLLVSGLIFMRKSPITPHVWASYEGKENFLSHRIKDTREWFEKHKDYIKFHPFMMDPCPPDALVKVGFTSTACMVVHRSVLEGIYDFVGPEWWVQDGREYGGEDRRFFQLAAIAGFEGYVDRSCVVGHRRGDSVASVADFIAWDTASTFKGTGEPTEKSNSLETVNADGGKNDSN